MCKPVTHSLIFLWIIFTPREINTRMVEDLILLALCLNSQSLEHRKHTISVCMNDWMSPQNMGSDKWSSWLAQTPTRLSGKTLPSIYQAFTKCQLVYLHHTMRQKLLLSASSFADRDSERSIYCSRATQPGSGRVRLWTHIYLMWVSGLKREAIHTTAQVSPWLFNLCLRTWRETINSHSWPTGFCLINENNKLRKKKKKRKEVPREFN